MTSAYPLQWPEGWPRSRRREERSRFSTTFDKARRNLLAELDRLGARNVVVSSWLPLRLDGQPRADMGRRQLEDPGVAVYFTLRGKPMVMARDGYRNVHDNLHSIGHAIAHLRGLERHGGAAMMERSFAGFAALPAPQAPKPWREVLPGVGGGIDQAEYQYRLAAMKAHPDNGGSHERMAELNLAIEQARKELGA